MLKPEKKKLIIFKRKKNHSEKIKYVRVILPILVPD